MTWCGRRPGWLSMTLKPWLAIGAPPMHVISLNRDGLRPKEQQVLPRGYLLKRAKVWAWPGIRF